MKQSFKLLLVANLVLKTQKSATMLGRFFRLMRWFGKEKGDVWLWWGQGRDPQVSSESGPKSQWGK